MLERVGGEDRVQEHDGLGLALEVRDFELIPGCVPVGRINGRAVAEPVEPAPGLGRAAVRLIGHGQKGHERRAVAVPISLGLFESRDGLVMTAGAKESSPGCRENHPPEVTLGGDEGCFRDLHGNFGVVDGIGANATVPHDEEGDERVQSVAGPFEQLAAVVAIEVVVAVVQSKRGEPAGEIPVEHRIEARPAEGVDGGSQLDLGIAKALQANVGLGEPPEECGILACRIREPAKAVTGVLPLAAGHRIPGPIKVVVDLPGLHFARGGELPGVGKVGGRARLIARFAAGARPAGVGEPVVGRGRDQSVEVPQRRDEMSRALGFGCEPIMQIRLGKAGQAGV